MFEDDHPSSTIGNLNTDILINIVNWRSSENCLIFPPSVKFIFYVFLGSGQSTSKVVSIAEILKRRHKHIQERIELGERLVQEFWEPKDEDECLDTLVVTRRIPTIHVLLDVSQKPTLTPDDELYEAWWGKPDLKTKKEKGVKPDPKPKKEKGEKQEYRPKKEKGEKQQEPKPKKENGEKQDPKS